MVMIIINVVKLLLINAYCRRH